MRRAGVPRVEKRVRATILIIAACAAVATQAPAMPEPPTDGPAALVANINRTIDPRAGSRSWGFTTAGRYVFFVADDGEVGEALWRTDGTPDGTIRLAEIAAQPVAVGDAVVLSVDGDLWRSDGTPAGTRALREGHAYYLTAVGESVFFLEERQLWHFDPRTGESLQLASFADDPLRSDIRDLVAVGDHLFFTGCTAAEGCELWRSDGTTVGTIMVRDLAPGPADGRQRYDYDPGTAVVDGVLYFVAEDPQHGAELWRSDGTTAGTRRVKDIRRGPEPAFLLPYNQFEGYMPRFATVGRTLLFVASDGRTGFELWRSDGSAAGTRMVGDLVPGADGLFDCAAAYSDCQPFETHLMSAVVGTELFFTVRQVVPGDAGYEGITQLWSSDGTAAGTHMLEAATDPETESLDTAIAAMDGRVFFTRTGNAVDTDELWARDPTATASERIASIDLYATLRHGSDVGLIIARWQGEPWWSDGTATGTYLLKEIRGDDAGSFPRPLGALGDALLFSATDGLHGFELWRSDGSEAGTQLVTDIAPGAPHSDPQPVLAIDGGLLFTADDGVHGRELWRSDGTAAGTRMVADVRPGFGDADIAKVARAGERIYFVADDGRHGRELWVSDLARDTTNLVRDIRAGIDSGVPGSDWRAPVAILGADAYFGADDGVAGNELWRSDGTAAGTELVADLVPGAGHSYPGDITAWDGFLFFTTHPEPVPGGEIVPFWRSDGTAGGTVRIADLPSAYSDFVIQGDVAYFVTYGADTLWRMDGARGTPVAVESGAPYQLLDAGGALIGHRSNGIWRQGYDLIHPSWSVGDLAAFDRRTVFIEGRYWDTQRLGSTGGVADSTVEIQRLAPAEDDAYAPYECEPARFTRAGERVFFTAQVGEVGCELWSLPLDALSEVCVEDCPPPPTATPTAGPVTPSPTPVCGDADCTQLIGGTASGARGETVRIDVSLRARREPVAGVQNDLRLSPNLRVPARSDGRPDCTVNPEIGKPASAFVFLPSNCRPGRTCTAVRALVLSLDDVAPIADGALLYTCAVTIEPRAPLGELALRIEGVSASTSEGVDVSVHAVDPVVTVLGRGDSGVSAAGDGCQVGPTATPWQWLGLLVLLLKPPRRQA